MTEADILRLALQAKVSHQTVRRWAKGESVYSNTAERLTDAARELNIKIPRGLKPKEQRHA